MFISINHFFRFSSLDIVRGISASDLLLRADTVIPLGSQLKSFVNFRLYSLKRDIFSCYRTPSVNR